MQARSINHWKSWVSIACNSKWAHTVQCSPYRHPASGKAVAQNRSYQISLHGLDTLVSPSLLHNCQSGGLATHASHAGRLLGQDKSVPSCPPLLIVFSFVDFHLLTLVSSMLSVINSPTLLRDCFGCAHNRTILHRSSILAWALWCDAKSCPHCLARVHETLHGWCMSL